MFRVLIIKMVMLKVHWNEFCGVSRYIKDALNMQNSCYLCQTSRYLSLSCCDLYSSCSGGNLELGNAGSSFCCCLDS